MGSFTIGSKKSSAVTPVNISTMSCVVTGVSFERDSRGRAVVGWSVSGDCAQVDIVLVDSPDAITHLQVRTVDADLRYVLLDDVPLGRAYVSVAPSGCGKGVIAGERNLGLLGARNFRDLGGYRGAGGARTRWGQVFRSDALTLEEADFLSFAGLGVRTVYDLRSDPERELTPNRLPDGDHVVESLPLISDGSPAPTIDALLADGERFLADIYLHMLEGSAPAFGRILAGLADAPRLPAVFHCAAGKDRTGMVAALLLSVLGVAEPDILDDYELTSRYRTSDRVEAVMERMSSERGVAPEVAAGILRTPRWAMQCALAQLGARYGGIEGYLTGPAGVDPTVPGALRAQLMA
jgi:protein-tyrosine phosphatase